MLCQFSQKNIKIILVECNKIFNMLLKMFKTLDKGSTITFSRGLYTEFTRYCEVLGTNIFPICQYPFDEHSLAFVTIHKFLSPFVSMLE